MWEIQKRVMRAKRVILSNDWEVDEGKLTRTFEPRVSCRSHVLSALFAWSTPPNIRL